MSQSRFSGVPEVRLRELNEQPVRTDGKFVLYSDTK